MSLPKELIPTLGPITAAIIAGSISFIVTVLSKDQKTSEFRQAWIDSLREEISELLSIFNIILNVLNRKRLDGKKEDEIVEYAIERKDDFARMHELAIKIRLRLNPKEHNKILKLLKELEDGEWKPGETNKADELIDSITVESQIILKKEWERVKTGEFSLRAIKWISLSLLVTSSIVAVFYFNEYFKIEYTP